MIIVTGAAGFIGSNLVSLLNSQGIQKIVLVDAFDNEVKNKNLHNKDYIARIHRDDFFTWLELNHQEVKFIFHLGARTNTAEFDKAIFDKLNLNYSISVFKACSRFGIPLIYASSAATYGLGESGYLDDHSLVKELKPLNPYGESKNEFDKWVLGQTETPPFWAGLKFFNVYGPNEFHKGRMASVIFHAFGQIKQSGKMNLFRSHKQGIPDGGQKRDFIYVKDVVSVILYLHKNRPESGIFNLGTGKARTFLDLTVNTFKALDLEPQISFIDTPEDIREKYQYFTEAKMEKLHSTGYNKPFYTLEEGIEDYVRNYLMGNEYS
jgi:ADP-L-glycero-D-manno-heptose 6-epimerase